MKRLMIFLLLSMTSSLAAAHDTGSISLALILQDTTPHRLAIEMDVEDLALVVQLDQNQDGQLNWQEYTQSQSAIFNYLQRTLILTSEGHACPLIPEPQNSGIRTGAVPSIRSTFSVQCSFDCPTLQIYNQLFSEFSAAPLVFLRIQSFAGDIAEVIRPGINTVTIATADKPWALFSFLKSGVYHILIGVDHLAFLLLLLIPVLREGNVREKWREMLAIVTAFTVAHSVTLTLSATGYISLPQKPVEIAIAVSVVIAGILSLVRFPAHQGWLLAYGFGLIHGFGFASVLIESASSRNLQFLNLAAFNLGVELGQIMFILLVVPTVYWLIGRFQQLRRAFPVLSLTISALGCFWIVERL